MDFSIVTGKTVHRVVHEDIEGCAAVVRDAYLAHHRGESVNPNSYFLRFPDRPDARIIALPASLRAGFDLAGIKWISSFPSNLRRGIPRASAVLVLNDLETGYPFALLEASIISAARTAASAALAAEALAGRRAAGALGLVGTGLIARYLYTFLLRLGWDIGEIRLFDADPAEARRFQAAACDAARHARVEVSPDLGALLRASDLVAFTTTAARPHVHDPALLAHGPIVLHLSLRDLSPAIIRASHNVVDDVDHVMTAQTSVHLAEQASGGRDFLSGTIAEALRGELRLGGGRPVVVSPFGLGVLDLAVGRWVFERARARGDALPIEEFFFEMTR
ncbi:MAG: 2,3-diaminopropionate biosynthesis protein SbnB [Polyangiaceae bacterium]|nr:2,3-diaminopropionate biosynthesis protein SbnB [Polyangiaceae bacterium]